MGSANAEQKRAAERMIFKTFLETRPLFAGERIPPGGWRSCDQDPPDIVCMTEGRRRIGVELKSWLNESEISVNKPMVDFFDSVNDVVAPLPPNRCTHISHVSLLPKTRVSRVRDSDRTAFRAELLRFISELDANWKAQWNRPPPRRLSNFGDKKTLARYVLELWVYPRYDFSGCMNPSPPEWYWIMPVAPANSYDDATMRGPLLDILEEALRKNQRLPGTFAEFHLVIHYDEMAIFYNSPAETLQTRFENHVDAARAVIKINGSGPFDGIFVFVADGGRGRSFVIHPTEPATGASS